ncbi:MAG: tetratricopeptide repeat protein [Planctomycetes bacterium]|nr:tetratricopeptide repeat protein [Planctomycetota bacterium]
MFPRILTQIEFGRYGRQPDSEIDLAVAAGRIAEDEYPRLRPSDILRPLADLAARAPRLPGAPDRVRAAALARFLFKEEGFGPDEAEYYDPRNSYLNEVLARKVGIPLTLSLVLIEVAHRVGIPLVGIGFPRRFLVGLAGDTDFFVDPYGRGRVLDLRGTMKLHEELGGPRRSWRPAFACPASNKEILQRLLRNLKEIFLRREDIPRCLAATEKLAALSPDDLEEVRDRGVLSLHGRAWIRALADLETYLAGRPEAEDSDLIRSHVRVLRDTFGATIPVAAVQPEAGRL